MFNPQKKYLYYPYGDTLKSAMVGNYDSDLNAFGELASHEMPYSQMGYRVYSEDFGRFLSPDPLFEQFDSWTPYHFGFNNPVMYSDPSGLAPKKEKREARLLFSPAVEEREKLLKMIEEAERIFLWAQAYHNSFMMESNISYNRWQDGLHGGGGGSGNYNPGKIDLVALKKEYEEAKAEREKINQEKGIIEFKTAEDREKAKEIFSKQFNIRGGTAKEQANFLDYLVDHIPVDYLESDDIITIDIGLKGAEIAELYNESFNPNECAEYLLGLYGHNERTMYIASEYINNPNYDEYSYSTNLFGLGSSKYNLWQVFGHEYGHHLDHTFYGLTNEGLAEWRVNGLRKMYGVPLNIQYMRFNFWQFKYIYPED